MFRRKQNAMREAAVAPVAVPEFVPAAEDQLDRLHVAVEGIWRFARSQWPNTPKVRGYNVHFSDELQQAQMSKQRHADIVRTTITKEAGGLTLAMGSLWLSDKPADNTDRWHLMAEDHEYSLEAPFTSTFRRYMALVLEEGSYIRQETLDEWPILPLTGENAVTLSGRFERILAHAHVTYGFDPNAVLDPSVHATLD